jgi:type IV secretory pathway VirB10-like protein
MPNTHTPVYDLPPQYTFLPPQAQAHLTPEPNNVLPDPYLSARYQQPLPLPVGSNASPPRQPPARRDPAAEAAEIRRQAALQEEQERVRKREQEEADAELARRLDRELNSGDLEDERTRTHMPGAW